MYTEASEATGRGGGATGGLKTPSLRGMTEGPGRVRGGGRGGGSRLGGGSDCCAESGRPESGCFGLGMLM